jgi:bifunctional ADP-heptose synthase (sugar kinase/adenylyltransferase)
MALFEPGKPRLDIPATGTEEVTDVSGAGDTVIAVATLALTAGTSFSDAARLSNAAAGVVVMKAGAATCSPAELAAAVESIP